MVILKLPNALLQTHVAAYICIWARTGAAISNCLFYIKNLRDLLFISSHGNVFDHFILLSFCGFLILGLAPDRFTHWRCRPRTAFLPRLHPSRSQSSEFCAWRWIRRWKQWKDALSPFLFARRRLVWTCLSVVPFVFAKLVNLSVGYLISSVICQFFGRSVIFEYWLIVRNFMWPVSYLTNG